MALRIYRAIERRGGRNVRETCDVKHRGLARFFFSESLRRLTCGAMQITIQCFEEILYRSVDSEAGPWRLLV